MKPQSTAAGANECVASLLLWRASSPEGWSSESLNQARRGAQSPTRGAASSPLSAACEEAAAAAASAALT